MMEEKIPKFSKFIRSIGMIIAIASIIGIIIALIFFIEVFGKEFRLIKPSTYAIGTGEAILVEDLQMGFSFFLGFLSLSGGLISSILLKKNKFYKCLGCDNLIEKHDPRESSGIDIGRPGGSTRKR